LTGAPEHREPHRYLVAFVAALIGIGPLSIDAYLPALPTMAESLDSTIVAANVTVSSFLIGYAIGQLFGGPISDQIGRMRVALFGLILLAVCSVWIAFANNMPLVQWLRGLQAVGGGFATVVAMAMIRDSFPPAEAAKRYPLVMLILLGAPLFAPGIGAALLPLGWPSIFIFLAGYAVVIALLFPAIGESLPRPGGKVRLGGIVPQYLAVLKTRVNGRLVPLRFIFSQGLITSVMMIFITNSAFIYLDYFAVGEQNFMFFFGANIVVMMVFSLTTSRVVGRVAPFTLFRGGRIIQLTALAVLVTCVFLAEEPETVWFTPLLALAIGTAGMIGPSVNALYLSIFDRLAGSAASLMATASFVFGGVLGALSSALHDGTLRPVMATMLLAVVMANLIAATIPAPAGTSARLRDTPP
jgi:DHA1 family bicyclomycin/chloramphenicol resistance-like MFS transporter